MQLTDWNVWKNVDKNSSMQKDILRQILKFVYTLHPYMNSFQNENILTQKREEIMILFKMTLTLKWVGLTGS